MSAKTELTIVMSTLSVAINQVHTVVYVKLVTLETALSVLNMISALLVSIIVR